MLITEYHPFGWTWTAIYSGYDPENPECQQDEVHCLNEVREDGTLRHFDDIDQDRITALVLQPKEDHLHQYGVLLGDDKRLIFFRRRCRILDLSTGEQYDGPTYHVIGYQRTVDGHNIKHFQYIAEDGTSFISDDPNAV